MKIGHSDTILKSYLRKDDISKWHCSGGDPWLIDNLTKLVKSMFTGKYIFSILLSNLKLNEKINMARPKSRISTHPMNGETIHQEYMSVQCIPP